MNPVLPSFFCQTINEGKKETHGSITKQRKKHRVSPRNAIGASAEGGGALRQGDGNPIHDKERKEGVQDELTTVLNSSQGRRPADFSCEGCSRQERTRRGMKGERGLPVLSLRSGGVYAVVAI